MTGGWAATNTLREYTSRAIEPLSHYAPSRRDADAAIARVEAALDAAEKFCQRLDAPEYLREALRAVREGK